MLRIAQNDVELVCASNGTLATRSPQTCTVSALTDFLLRFTKVPVQPGGAFVHMRHVRCPRAYVRSGFGCGSEDARGALNHRATVDTHASTLRRTHTPVCSNRDEITSPPSSSRSRMCAICNTNCKSTRKPLSERRSQRLHPANSVCK